MSLRDLFPAQVLALRYSTTRAEPNICKPMFESHDDVAEKDDVRDNSDWLRARAPAALPIFCRESIDSERYNTMQQPHHACNSRPR